MRKSAFFCVVFSVFCALTLSAQFARLPKLGVAVKAFETVMKPESDSRTEQHGMAILCRMLTSNHQWW